MTDPEPATDPDGDVEEIGQRSPAKVEAYP